MTIRFDNTYWKNGVRLLAGVDEVGRGPLGGPVVAAAVIWPPAQRLTAINDSKKLNEKKRQELEPLIREKALCYAVAEASVEEIDRHNIIKATFLAMKRCLNTLEQRPEFVLVDGRDFPSFLYRDGTEVLKGQAVIKGDGKSLSIAAASILAKVHRDRLMEKWHEQWPQYGFDKHKGYATAEHLAAIDKHGACEIHRKTFLRRFGSKTGSKQMVLFE